MEMSVTEARKRISELTHLAQKEPLIITRRGKPYLAIISYREYAEMRDDLVEAGQWPFPKKPE